MNNFEKVLKEHKDLYEERIFRLIATNIALDKNTGDVKVCENISCNDCSFCRKESHKHCTNAAAEWLRQEG